MAHKEKSITKMVMQKILNSQLIAIPTKAQIVQLKYDLHTE